MKATIALVGLAIVYAILQQQLPCNFSVTCLAGMPTFHQALVNPWTGKVRPSKPIRPCEFLSPPFDCESLERNKSQSKGPLHAPSGRVHYEVCVSFNGRRNCRLESAATQQEAVRRALSNSCALLASGVTETTQCENTKPDSVEWMR